MEDRRTGAPSGKRDRKLDGQLGNGQAMTLSGVSRHVDHEFAAELGANGLPGWMGGISARPVVQAGSNNEDPGP